MLVESHTQQNLEMIRKIINATSKIIDIDNFVQIRNIIQNTINSIPDIAFSCLCFLQKELKSFSLYSPGCRDCENNEFPQCRFVCNESYKEFSLAQKNHIYGKWIIRFNNSLSGSFYEPYISCIFKTFSLKIAGTLKEQPYLSDESTLPCCQTITFSPDLLMKLAHDLPFGLCIFHMENPADDSCLRIVYANPATEEFTGIKPEKIIGTVLKETLKPLSNLDIPAMLSKVICQQKPFFIENRKYGEDLLPEENFAVKFFPLPDNHAGLIFENNTQWIEMEQERETVISALFESAKAVLQKESFFEAARIIFNHLKNIIKAKAGYMALLSADNQEIKVLFLYPEGFSLEADPNFSIHIREIKDEAFITGKPVYYNDFSSSGGVNSSLSGQENLKNVLFIPLNVSGKAEGFIGLANKEGGFTIKDTETGTAFGELAAIALKNAYNIESLKTSEQKYRQLVNTLQEGIWMIDQQAIITFVNPEMTKMLGYTETEMIGKSFFSFLDEHEIDLARERLEKRKKGITEKYECEFIKKDGTLIYTRVAAAPLLNNNGNYAGTLAGITDLAERKKAETQLENSLKEKEILLQEIHHRVKNNLMVISSLMGLQIRRIKDKSIQSILEDTRNRVYTMSLTHQLLYQSRNFDHINLKRYIHDLLYYLVQSFKINTGNINIKIEVEEIRLNLTQAIPCGMIINELVSNSMKYAFPDDCRGEINIVLYTENGNIVLKVNDNGIGFPAGFDTTRTESLGMFLIHSFSDQLNGTAQYYSQGGVTFMVTFPCINLQEKEV